MPGTERERPLVLLDIGISDTEGPRARAEGLQEGDLGYLYL